MATHDYVIANGTGAAVRSDLNDALAAIVSNNSSSSEPATTYAYQWWADTTNNLLKLRNSANNAWITLRELDGTLLMEDGSASTPGLSFASDTNTGFFSGGADKIGFATGGAERLEIGSSEVVFNDPSNDVDFRVESNGQTHMLFVDAGNDRVGIGTSSPSTELEIKNASTSAGLTITTGNTTEDGFINFSDGSTAGQILYKHSDNYMRFYVNSSERLRIDSSGRLLVGTSSARGGFDNSSVVKSDLQVEGVGSAASANRTAISIVNNGSADADSAGLYLARSGGTSVGSFTAVTANDVLARITFSGADGSEFVQAASIEGVIDGTPGANDMPGRLVFSTTADGASSPTERLRIDSSGNLTLKTTSSAGKFIFQEGSDNAWSIDSNGANGYLRFYDEYNSSERMRIDNAGNVGIGTSTPSAQLESQGNVSSTTQFSGFQGLRIQNTNGAAFGVSADINFVAGTGTNNRGAVIGAVYESGAGGNDLYFATNGSAVTSNDTPTEKVRIQSNGQVEFKNGSFSDNIDCVMANSGTMEIGAQTEIKFRTATNERMRVTNNGLTFNGDTAAANALDDYERGTWTPTIDRSSSGPSVTYTERDGRYVKVGDIVTAFFDVTTSSISGGSGTPQLTGLPFAMPSAHAGYSAIQWRSSDAFVAGSAQTVLRGYVEQGQSYLVPQLDNIGTSGYGFNSQPSWGGSGRITGYVTYQTET